MRQQTVDMYRQVPDATAFVRTDGTRLKSLKALEMALYTMNEGEFLHHVNSARNDFSSWVLHVFNYRELAQDLAQAKTRAAMLGVLDEVSHNVPAKVTVAQTAITPKASPKESQKETPKSVQTAVNTTGLETKPGKSFHHKLKGMFKAGTVPVTEQNAQEYARALAAAKQSAINADLSTTIAKERTIHEQINHLDNQLAHMTRHHVNTSASDDVGSAALEETVKERILDFSLGLIVGLMLGFILAKSFGL